MVRPVPAFAPLVALVLSVLATMPTAAQSADGIVSAEEIYQKLVGAAPPKGLEPHKGPCPAASDIVGSVQVTPAPGVATGTIDLTVTFGFGKATLTDQAVAQLNQAADALRAGAAGCMAFEIDGHTDAVGGRAANLALSQRRAEAVVDYLSDPQIGVLRRRLRAIGNGFDHLADPDHPRAAVNRRVQITAYPWGF